MVIFLSFSEYPTSTILLLKIMALFAIMSFLSFRLRGYGSILSLIYLILYYASALFDPFLMLNYFKDLMLLIDLVNPDISFDFS
jgi:hypothetical protein